MLSKGHLLYVLLLPLLVPLAAEDPEEPMLSEMMEHHAASLSSSSSTSGFPLPPAHPHHGLPHPALLLQLLRSGALRAALPSGDGDKDPSRSQDYHGHNNIAHPSSSSSNNNSEDLDNNKDAAESQEEEVEEEAEEVDQAAGTEQQDGVSKRVFCNTFTGCGGRHRDRSRRRQGLERLGKRLIPLLAKRPFCNSFGCYNGKRAVGVAMDGPHAGALRLPVQAVPVADLDLFPALRASLLAAAAEGKNTRVGEPVDKRLFCNGYGGCRGGKRSLFAPWLTKMNDVASGRR